MSLRALLSIALTLLLVAAPAAAWADGAGDQQYQDPLTAPVTPKKPKKQVAAAPVASAPAASSAPAAAAPAATSSTPAAAPPVASAQQLPRTGFPAGLVGLAGLTLIASGVPLRRRTLSQ